MACAMEASEVSGGHRGVLRAVLFAQAATARLWSDAVLKRQGAQSSEVRAALGLPPSDARWLCSTSSES